MFWRHDIQHNDTQHDGLICDTQHNVFGVIMLSVVRLNVVAPYLDLSVCFGFFEHLLDFFHLIPSLLRSQVSHLSEVLVRHGVHLLKDVLVFDILLKKIKLAHVYLHCTARFLLRNANLQKPTAGQFKSLLIANSTKPDALLLQIFNII
jgi:hypothetical protein